MPHPDLYAMGRETLEESDEHLAGFAWIKAKPAVFILTIFNLMMGKALCTNKIQNLEIKSCFIPRVKLTKQ